jgi:hypothetical protein
VIVFGTDGRYSATVYVNGQPSESDQGTWRADGRTLVTTDRAGTTESHAYAVRGNTLALDIPGMGRLELRRQ